MCLGKEKFAGTSPAVLVICRGAYLAIINVVNTRVMRRAVKTNARSVGARSRL
jgi:hypothetical protein